jgi:hypothetical protein
LRVSPFARTPLQLHGAASRRCHGPSPLLWAGVSIPAERGPCSDCQWHQLVSRTQHNMVNLYRPRPCSSPSPPTPPTAKILLEARPSAPMDRASRNHNQLAWPTIVRNDHWTFSIGTSLFPSLSMQPFWLGSGGNAWGGCRFRALQVDTTSKTGPWPPWMMNVVHVLATGNLDQSPRSVQYSMDVSTLVTTRRPSIEVEQHCRADDLSSSLLDSLYAKHSSGLL